jgi:hypothetical protein
MATVVKIRGLDRSNSNAVAGDGSATGGSYRGFKVPSTLGPTVTGGTSVKASLAVGSGTNGVTYTSKIGGVKGNDITIVQSAAAGTFSVAVTYAASTGKPTITVVPKTGETINQLIAQVNADPAAAQFVTASPVSDGLGTTPATQAGAALANGANGTGTSEPFYQSVNSKSTVLVDLDDQKTVRNLKRNANRWISLGQV